MKSNGCGKSSSRKRKPRRQATATETTRDDKGNQDSKSDHSSEERRKGDKPKPKKTTQDRRSFKDLPIHDTIDCPVDPATLPPDAVRLDDEIVIVQDIEIKPKNTKCQRQVFYSTAEQKFYRGPLPAGYDQGDFSADLRALIVALKYCGNMSEPKIGEFLENSVHRTYLFFVAYEIKSWDHSRAQVLPARPLRFLFFFSLLVLL